MSDHDGRFLLPRVDHIQLVARNDNDYLFEFRSQYDPRWKAHRVLIAAFAIDLFVAGVTAYKFDAGAVFVVTNIVSYTSGLLLFGVLVYLRSSRVPFLAQAWERCYADPRWQQTITTYELLVEWKVRLRDRTKTLDPAKAREGEERRPVEAQSVYEFGILRAYYHALCDLAENVELSIKERPLGCAVPGEGFAEPSDRTVEMARKMRGAIEERLQLVLAERTKLARDYKLPPRDANGVLVQRD